MWQKIKCLLGYHKPTSVGVGNDRIIWACKHCGVGLVKSHNGYWYEVK